MYTPISPNPYYLSRQLSGLGTQEKTGETTLNMTRALLQESQRLELDN